jgi:hypothetical protein
MQIEALKYINYRHYQISFIGTRDLYENIFSLRNFSIFIIMLFSSLCLTGVSTSYVSGHEYEFNFDYNENYIYQWSVSSGDYQENDKNTFTWRAPEVNATTEVTISVLITDKTCSCQSMDSKTVTVLPNEETKLSTKSLSNSSDLAISTNSTDKLYNNNESMPISANLTQNESIPIQEGNDTKLDPASEYPENITAPENLLSKAEIENGPTFSDLDQNDTETDVGVLESNPEQDLATSGYENDTTTESHPILDTNANQMTDEVDLAEAAENPSVTESATDAAEQEDQNLIMEISTLSFSDGTKVDVAFVEGNSESSTTFAKLQEDNTEWSEIISGSADSNNVDSLHNTTSISNSTINQKEENQSYSTESLETPTEMIAEATVSDAVESSDSPPLPVEATPDPE